MQAIQDIDGEVLALGNRLLAVRWFSHLVEMQGEPPICRRELHVQPVVGHGRNILHFGRFSGLFGLEHCLVERGAHQLGSAAPQGGPNELLCCGSGERLRARIGIDNSLGVIDDKQGTRKRLKHSDEHLPRSTSETPGLFCIRHTVVVLPFTSPSLVTKMLPCSDIKTYNEMM